jgi:predicted Fe-Mo cluster-binding NifX family protein
LFQAPLDNKQEIAMKIAITTSGNDLDAPIDSRFGRAPKFLIYDTYFDTYHVKDNKQNLNAAQGAGIQAALHLTEERVDCVITGNCGPKAYATLDAVRIAVYICKEGTVKEALELFKNGKLTTAQGASVEAHWA